MQFSMELALATFTVHLKLCFDTSEEKGDFFKMISVKFCRILFLLIGCIFPYGALQCAAPVFS